MKPISWGILATGNVANSMAQALHNLPDAELIAIASRSQEKADLFGDKWRIAHRYASYEDLLKNPEIDVVYIATPHNFHHQNIVMCLDAGKHVMCEKAFTLNAREAEDCIRLAREKNLFLMEAMWMRFFPVMTRIREWLQENRIGEIRLIQADFCLNIPFDAGHRLYNPATGGGALLDLGIYPLSFASMVSGVEGLQQILGHAHLAPTGVDELDSIILVYENGCRAVLSCGLRAYKPREAFIIGTEGYIKVHNIFFRPDYVTLHMNGREAEIFHLPYTDNGYTHEIQEVHDCLRNNQTESAIMPLSETLQIMKIMDHLRQDWGIVYPGEV